LRIFIAVFRLPWCAIVDRETWVRLNQDNGAGNDPGRIKGKSRIMPLTIEVEQEEDGRWIAEVVELPGVLAYGQTRQEAIDRAQSLSLRVLADRLDHGEQVPQVHGVFSVVP
jgi:predicted RNase H-like HicB family nuclease